MSRLFFRSNLVADGAVDGLNWNYASLTHCGRVRSHNEDAVGLDPAMGIAVLADGMGGYQGGEVASAMAVTLMQSSLTRWLTQAGEAASTAALRHALQEGADDANRAILEASQSNPELRGMGTTLVVTAFGSQRVVVGHIGDSRCYRLRRGRLKQLTKDHSFLQSQLDAGVITLEEAATSPHRNLVTRALGIEARVELEVHEHMALWDDIFLICSDGLHEMLPDEQIQSILSQNSSVPEQATQLVAIANENGGRDNISVVIAHAGRGPDTQ